MNLKQLIKWLSIVAMLCVYCCVSYAKESTIKVILNYKSGEYPS